MKLRRPLAVIFLCLLTASPASIAGDIAKLFPSRRPIAIPNNVASVLSASAVETLGLSQDFVSSLAGSRCDEIILRIKPLVEAELKSATMLAGDPNASIIQLTGAAQRLQSLEVFIFDHMSDDMASFGTTYSRLTQGGGHIMKDAGQMADDLSARPGIVDPVVYLNKK